MKVNITSLLLLVATLLSAQGPVADLSKVDEHQPIPVDVSAIYQQLTESRAATVEIPLGGTSLSFTAEQIHSMEPAFEQRYPEIKSYAIVSTTNASDRGRLTITPTQMWATVLTSQGMQSIFPTTEGHVLEQPGHIHSATCGHSTSDIHLNNQDWLKKMRNLGQLRGETFEFGDVRRRYRFAVVCTGEYYVNNGNTNATVAASIAASIDAFNVIYNNELNVELIGLTPVLFPNPATDPFIPDTNPGADGRTVQAGNAVNDNFNLNTYDIGHVFHQHADGDGWSNGGVASLGAVCSNATFGGGPPQKARGWSGAFNNTGNGWVSLASHEIAHMFGAPHTFNGEGSSCDDAISENTSYEIGSGTTIMSYQGICGDGQNIESSGAADNYFHTNSLFLMSNYILDQGGCGVEINVNNTPPDVDVNPCGEAYILPSRTPYVLRGAATDAEGDALTYTWEQYDEDGEGITPTQGEIGNAAGNNTVGPLVRSFPPSTSAERTIPRLATILDGGITSDPFEALSRRNREITFQLTVRDNNPTGGAIATDELVIQNISEGPLTMNSPGTISTGGLVDFTWSINGSEAACDVVDIYLSFDNGATFPYQIGNDVQYAAEMWSIVLPTSIVSTDEARLKIECADSECFTFFSISNDFRINSVCRAINNHICDTDPVSLDQGDPGLMLDVQTFIGPIVPSLTENVNSESTFGAAIMKNESGNCVEAFNSRYESRRIAVTASGSYTFTPDFTVGTPYIALFSASNYNEDNLCTSYVGASATFVGGGSFFPFGTITAQLEECEEYILHFYNNASGANNTIVGMSGPAGVIAIDEAPDPDYGFTYIAIRDNGVVSAVSDVADFTTLSGGVYEVFSVSYKQAGTTPPDIQDPTTWVGQSLATLLNNGGCILRSFESKPVEVLSGCGIVDIEVGTQTNCDPASNTYSQVLTITYENPPVDGNLRVNGVLFAIAGSPQSINLQGLISDGQPVDVSVDFTMQQSCSLFLQDVFTAPGSCCPITVDLGANIVACSDDETVLDAGSDGVAFKWFANNDEIVGAIESTFMPTETAVYTVEVQAPTGCTVFDEIDVVINPSPEVILPLDGSFCEGEEQEIVATTDAPNLQWYQDDQPIDGATDVSLITTTAGTYVLEGSNNAGCTATDTVILSAVPAPVVDLGEDQELCADVAPYMLDAGTDGTSYLWRRNGNELPETTPTLMATISGQYIVEVDNGGGCITRDTVLLQFFELPAADAGEDRNICAGGDPIEVFYTYTAESFVWFRDGMINSNQDEPLIVSEAGTYVLLVRNEIGCEVRDTIVIGEAMPPMVDLGEDVVGCEGSEVTLSTDIPGTYLWVEMGAGVVGMDAELTVTTPGTFNLIVTNGVGCQGNDQITVTFEPGPGLEIGDDRAICAGETATIEAVTDVDQVEWLLDGEAIAGETGTILQVSTAGVYTAVIVGGSGCVVEDMLTLTVNEVPVVNLGADQGICDGESVTLQASSTGDSYEWQLNGVAFSMADEVEITEEGEVRLTVTNAAGCSASDAINVAVGSNPTLALEDEYALCEGTTVSINAESDASVFSWTVNGEIVATNGSTIMVSEEAAVSVVATSAANCTTEATTVVTASPSPTVDLGMDQTLCPDDVVLLSAGNQTSYQWSTGESTGSINVENNGVTDVTAVDYTVTVTSEDGCEATDLVTITLLPELMPVVTASAPGVCGGEPVTLTASGGSTFVWSDATGTLTDIQGAVATALPTESTTYEVAASNEQCPGSAVSTTVTVEVFEQGEDLTAGEDKCVVIGLSTELEAAGGVSYLWEDDFSILGSTAAANPSVAPEEETTYTVAITDVNGCTYIDSVTICVLEDPLAEFLLVSVITPNGDGDNDLLEFRGLEAFPDNKLTIFNRWGNKVFERNRYQQDDVLWDGTNGGEELAPDTYYYILTFDGNTYKSPVTILR